MTEHQIKYVNIDDIIPNDKNPKEHDVEEIIRSFQRFGFTNPLIVDSNTNMLVAGHGRLQALIYLKRRNQQTPSGIIEKNNQWQVPTVNKAFLNENEAMAYIIADNKLTEVGQWNNEKLKNMVNELTDADVDLNSGIGIYDLSEFIDSLQELEHTNNDIDDPEENAYKPQYLVIVTADDERQQENLFEELQERGYNCRLLN